MNPAQPLFTKFISFRISRFPLMKPVWPRPWATNVAWRFFLFSFLVLACSCSRSISPDSLDKAAGQIIAELCKTAPAQEKCCIAAIGFVDFDSGRPTTTTKDLEDRLNHHLSQSCRFKVIEFGEEKDQQLREILKKHQDDLYDPDKSNPLGKFESLQYILTGSLKASGKNGEIQTRFVSLESKRAEYFRSSFQLGPSPFSYAVYILLGMAGVGILGVAARKLRKWQSDKDISPSMSSPNKCALCGRTMASVYQRGGKCLTPTCENPICTDCWNIERIRFCRACSEKKSSRPEDPTRKEGK